MKIIADTAALIAPSQGEENGVTLIPVSVCIDGITYQDYSDISTEEFLQRVAEGGVW